MEEEKYIREFLIIVPTTLYMYLQYLFYPMDEVRIFGTFTKTESKTSPDHVLYIVQIGFIIP